MIASTFFWTDSKITLQYINNESRRFKTYVANRVAEIRDISHPSQWRHCPGHLNPADDASRGLSASKLLNSERWFNGPDFLSKPEDEWPITEPCGGLADVSEVKDEKPMFNLTLPDKLNEMLLKYSSWLRLQRKIAWLLKFKAYLQDRKPRSAITIDVDKRLTAADLEQSTIAIVKLLQREAYGQEIKALEKREKIKSSSVIA